MILLSGFSDEISSDVIEQFEVLNKLNISYFEPRGINGKNISTLTDNEIDLLKESMEKYNIKVSSIGSPIGKVKISDDFEEHFNLFKRVVKIAKILGSRYIRIFSFYKDGKAWTDVMVKNVIERLEMMIVYAKENEIILLHENEKDIYGDSKERCLQLMENLYCDNFKAVFDPANFVQCGVDTKIA
jgi:sugar phosphate isomerase/epimerase